MDTRLSKALEFSNYSVTLSNQKRILNEKFSENCLYFTQGRQFTITIELINYVTLNANNSLYLIDDNQAPVLIDDPSVFLDNIVKIYQLAIEDYYNEYTKLTKQRSVENLINE